MKDRAKETVTAAAGEIRHLGDYIRDQRAGSGISLRQLAKLAGVSNPYLSQIERGLRKPSAEILQQIAKGLRISAEALYVQAGILDLREGDGGVADAVLADDGLTERQKQVLLEIYDSFRKENAGSRPAGAVPDSAVVSVVTAAEPQDLASALDTPVPAPPAPRARRRTPADAAPPKTSTTSTSPLDAPGGTA